MAEAPLISVVMPVYNAERFLVQALDSVLNQTLSNFELIVIDDGSTDRSAEILASYQQRDPRVRILTQPHNMGLVMALNLGCNAATGKFIARMDADDISLPQRFEKQISFMEQNPSVGLCGTWVEYIDEHDHRPGRRWHPPTDTELIRWTLLFMTCLAHPTWMMRRDVIKALGFYRSYNVEDYDLLVRASALTELANIPEELLLYRFWSQSKSSRNVNAEAPTPAIILKETLGSWFALHISIEASMQLRAAVAGYKFSPSYPNIVAEWIEKIYVAYCNKFRVSDTDLRVIQEDVAVKLLTLGVSLLQISPGLGFQLIRKSLIYSWSAPLVFIKKAIKNIRERSSI